MTDLPRPIVSAAWLAAHVDDVVIVDVRWYLDGRSGRAAYEQGHIPGAVFADLDRDLSGPPGFPGGRHPLPSPDAFAAAMGRLGVGDGMAVVVYDDASGAVAGRLWWMLDVLGETVAVLDGGIDSWEGPLDSDAPEVARASFTARPWPHHRVATANEVAGRGVATVVVDARSSERYAGEANTIDPRFGHIPGARSAPSAGNLAPGGTFAAPGELAARYAALGINPDTDVIAYCGSGVSACSDLLALRIAGHDRARLYVGSWSEWGADPDRPVQAGPDDSSTRT